MLLGMRAHRKWIMVVGVCAALPAGVALATGQGRLGVGGRTGQWTAGTCGTTEFRKAAGGEAFIEWLGDSVRVTAGFRVVREQILERSGTGAVAPGDGDVQAAAGVLAAYRHRWFEVGAGVGFLRYADVGHAARGTILPAATLRLGPEWLHARGSLLDFSAESLGLGTLKVGVGGRAGPVDLFGGLGIQPHLGGPTAGVLARLGDGLGLRADVLIAGEENGHFAYEAGLGVTYSFGGDDDAP
jgi:hypothetical protein